MLSVERTLLSINDVGGDAEDTIIVLLMLEVCGPSPVCVLLNEDNTG